MGALLPKGDRARVASWTLGTSGGERVHLQAISPAVCEWMGTSEVGLGSPYWMLPEVISVKSIFLSGISQPTRGF